MHPSLRHKKSSSFFCLPHIKNVKCNKNQKEKLTKSDLIKYQIDRMNVVTNESLKDLNVSRTHLDFSQ